jgi:hypothetical protein
MTVGHHTHHDLKPALLAEHTAKEWLTATM